MEASLLAIGDRDLARAAGAAPAARIAALAAHAPALGARLEVLVDLALAGLAAMYLGEGRFPHTRRRVAGPAGPALRLEGDSLRYAATVALGLGPLPEADQGRVLGGLTAPDLARLAARRAVASDELGAVALAAWAAAEVGGVHSPELFGRLAGRLAADQPADTVTCAWALAAALAARHLAETGELAAAAARRLRDGQAESGLFPHVLPRGAGARGRTHVGCFADQVYPIQALARLSLAANDPAALAAADRCAARIVALQGDAGQWWWHYDVRDGSVVEGFPVYSVHQHGMAPMALLELAEAGGTDHGAAIASGLGWLDRHPETAAPLVAPDEAVVWRKVARREPNKLARTLSALTTGLRPGWHLPGIEALLPPGRIDHECRPYELGWLLYAWRSAPLSGGSAQPR